MWRSVLLDTAHKAHASANEALFAFHLISSRAVFFLIMADGLQYNPPAPTLEIDQSKSAPVYDQSQTPKTDVKDSSGRYSYIPAADVNGSHSRMEDGKLNHARILGIRRRKFWFLVILAVVLVGATIGSSIGGVLAVQNKA
jgi:hypothetical protein